MLKEHKTLPVNIKLCIEGEEECGCVGLSKILKDKKEELKADYLAIVDVGIPGPKTPSVTLGVRGLITMDVSVKGSKTDMHAGSNGGLAYNPIHALVEILSNARDPSGKIAIPGFYDDVVPVSVQDKASVFLDFDSQEYERMFGIPPTGGEHALPPRERNWLRPTLEINGITGGYSGAGFKTVIPAQACAKDPQKIGQLVKKYLESKAPAGTKVEVTVHPGIGRAVRAEMQSKIVRAYSEAYADIFQKPCKYIYEGASIPIVTDLAKASGAAFVLVGLGLADDQIHAPNEHFGLDRFKQGFMITMRALEILGSL
jgi:acetylornithine deacetylase/succinyl-diaminopimelate desuccinylase-like protein